MINTENLPLGTIQTEPHICNSEIQARDRIYVQGSWDSKSVSFTLLVITVVCLRLIYTV